METQINELIRKCTENANDHGWKIYWHKLSIDKHDLSVGEALALCHSELSEALEAYRDNDTENFDEEIADEFIRLFHICGDLGIDIEKSIEDKMKKNISRPKNHGRFNY